ncbi:hypothetical protein [Roseovarius amoyensis]|uniref:hypothetical protein n=1 Tax=Roseovarius amoyensis TaxID=2211448 RepID=UPI000DBE2FCA|nr:hypothetical protein [Roseovarius amoyensis]
MTAWQALGIAPGPVLRVYGLRRSGNHAVINWLQRNAPGGRALFFNNCKPGRDPFTTFRAAEIDARRVAGADADAAAIAQQAGDGAALILSYEDVMPGKRRRPVSTGVDDAAVDHEVIVARGFMNWAASLVRKLQANPAYSAPKRVAIVLTAVTTYTAMLNLMTGEAEPRSIAIRYDDWRVSPDYRAGRLARLGFENRDDTLGPVQGYGNGSSFPDTAETGEDLRANERWREMKDDPEYRIVLWLAAQDAGLCEGLERVFPDDAARLARLAATVPVDPAATSTLSAHGDAPENIFRRN